MAPLDQTDDVGDHRATLELTLTWGNLTNIPPNLGEHIEQLTINPAFSMTTLDLHECGPYPELARLTVDNSALTSVISAPLTYTPSLTTIEIFRCQMTSLPGFGPLESQLQHLAIKRCKIPLIPDGYFTNFGALSRLNLLGNKIEWFDPQWLSSSPNLMSLN